MSSLQTPLTPIIPQVTLVKGTTPKPDAPKPVPGVTSPTTLPQVKNSPVMGWGGLSKMSINTSNCQKVKHMDYGGGSQKKKNKWT